MIDIIEYTGHHPNFLPSYIIVSTAAVNIFCLLMMYRLKQRLDIDFRVCFRFVHRRDQRLEPSFVMYLLQVLVSIYGPNHLLL